MERARFRQRRQQDRRLRPDTLEAFQQFPLFGKVLFQVRVDVSYKPQLPPRKAS
jgi:hypothetical protein